MPFPRFLSHVPACGSIAAWFCIATASAREPSLSEMMEMMQPALELRAALQKGDGRTALPLAVKNYGLSKRSYGPTHPTTLASLGNLAAAQQLTGQYTLAEKTYLTLLPLVENTPMPAEAPKGADKLDRMEAYVARQTVINNRKGFYNNLANLYETMGRLPEAEQASLKALEFMGQFPDANITEELSVLGSIYLAMRDYAAARKPYEECRDMMLLRVKNGVDEKRGYPYNNLGILEAAAGNVDLALEHLREALAIRRASLKDEPHPDLAISWTNLGDVLLEHRPESRQEALQALENGYAMGVRVHGAAHPETLRKAVPLVRARLIAGKTELARTLLDEINRLADKSKRTSYPTLDDELCSITAKFALATQATDVPQQMRRELDRLRAEMGGMMRFSSETRRIGWSRDRSPIGMLVRHGDARMIAECLLLTKGLVQESVFSEHAACQRAVASGKAALVEELSAAEGELHALRESYTEVTSGTASLRGSRRSELEEKVTSLRQRIGIRADDLLAALEVKPEDVSRALPEGAALVDFCVAEPWEADYSGHRRYGAVVYTAAEPRVRLLDLGRETEVDQLISTLRAAVLKLDDAAASEAGRAVFTKLIAPLLNAAPETSRWFFCPDGELQTVPFAAIQMPDGKFMAENAAVTLLPSARALARPQTEGRTAAPGKMLLVGDVDFRASGKQGDGRPVTPTIARAYAGANLDFPALPGTAEEVRLLREAAAQSGWKTVMLTGAEATVSGMTEAVAGATVVHLATHGGVLPMLKDRSQPLELPFYSSFITAAGAQLTLERLKQSGKRGHTLDGLLTAANAAALPLQDTLLVTLSACETGLGSAEKGEGVLGIARALHSAGARCCVSSLWPVEDMATVELMKRFYAGVLQGTPPSEALRQAQAACLREWSAQGTARAMFLAGGFVVSSREAVR